MARRRTTKAVAEAAAAMLRVAIYIRRSTDEDHQPFSLQAQDTRLRAYITSQPGWRLVATFRDDASGAKLDRPDLREALTAARAGQFDILLVYRVDRLTRSIRDLSHLLQELDKAGVGFRSATEPFDTATPAGRMMVQMLAVFAEFERALIIDRVVAGMERKAAAGRWTLGTAPYGYTIDPTTHVLTPHPGEAPIIERIFHLYTRQRLGTRAIATRLNTSGLRRRTGRAWTHKTVTDVLVNPAYLGQIHFRDVVVNRAHPALVDPGVFELAERILTERGENPAKNAGAASNYHLTGKITCRLCGRRYLGSNATGRHRVYRYYTCHTRSRHGVDRCPAPRVDADTLDAAVLAALGDFHTLHPQLVTEAVARARAEYNEARALRGQELAAITGQLAAKQAAVDKHLAAYEDNQLDRDTLARRVSQLNDEVRQLRQLRDQAARQLRTEPAAPQQGLAEARHHISEIINNADTPLRKALCDAAIVEVRLTDTETATPVFAQP